MSKRLTSLTLITILFAQCLATATVNAKEHLGLLRAAIKELEGKGGGDKWRSLISETIKSIENAPEPHGTLRSIASLQST